MKIVFFGDSITDASHGYHEEELYKYLNYGSGYVIQVAGRLFSDNPVKHQIINKGISGNRIVDLYARIKSDVWNLQPDVLSILIGVNDVWHEIMSQNGVDIKRFEKVYSTLIEDTLERLPNTKIVLLEPFVLKGMSTSERFDEFLQVKDYAKVVKKLAHKYGLFFISLQDDFDKASEKYGVEPYLIDGVHPNIAGSSLIAEKWIKLFKDKIEK